jgi:hypothetical protein
LKLKHILSNDPQGSLLQSGNGTRITNEELGALMEKDETQYDDLSIGYKNARAIVEDQLTKNLIDVKNITDYYWTYREKPADVHPKNPSDIILRDKDNRLLGFSNKAVRTGKDSTPKFNTSVNAFFKNTPEYGVMERIADKSWEYAINNTPKEISDVFKKYIPDISDEKFTEAGSKRRFENIYKELLIEDERRGEKTGASFTYFYTKFRNFFIESWIKRLKLSVPLEIFLKVFHEYANPEGGDNPTPYLMLIGHSKQDSTIKNPPGEDPVLASALSGTPYNIKSKYEGGQSFTLTFSVDATSYELPITARTRTSPHWIGKALYITTSGLKARYN